MAAFSPDGNTIVTASNDNTARVWTADRTGTPIVLKGHTDWVRSAAFSPDGNTIVTASNDNTARVWHVGVVPVRLGYFAENATAKLVDGIDPCMLPASRTRYLGDDEATALARWRGCEREC